jgi:hypothetical protein
MTDQKSNLKDKKVSVIARKEMTKQSHGNSFRQPCEIAAPPDNIGMARNDNIAMELK